MASELTPCPLSALAGHSSDHDAKLQALCQILTPIGMVGYGFDEELNRTALQELALNDTPTALILDSGSTDSGPDKLALGIMTASRSNYVRDVRKLMRLSNEFHVPIIISSAGGNGSDAHVDTFLEIIQEICQEEGNSEYKFKTLAIYSNISKARVLRSLRANEVKGCGVSVPALTEKDIEDAVEIVAQMGPESFTDAMTAEPDFDIIIGGRSYDPSPYIAYCIHLATLKLPLPLEALKAQQLGGFAFMGKIMECGALCSTPKSSSAQATVYVDGTFDIKPLSPESRCSPSSVAAHTLYEKSRPDILPGPGGDLNLNTSKYEQLPDGRSVRVSGSQFHLSRTAGLPYTVKLEAAKSSGYRTITMGGIRDPILISQIDDFLLRVKEFVAQQNEECTETWELDFHVYGVDGVMGTLEPGDRSMKPREVFIVAEALSTTQDHANSTATNARIALVHGPYPGQRATSGNFAFGIGGKLLIEMGRCTEFCIYHLIPLSLGQEGAYRIDDEMDSKTRLEQQLQGLPLFSWKMAIIGSGIRKSISHAPLAIPPKSTNTAKITAKRGRQIPTMPRTVLNLTNPQTLCDIAPIVRSKNSGPYDITLDVIFSIPEIYKIIKSSNLLTLTTVAKLYHLQEKAIVYCGFYDPAIAFKVTLPRKRGNKMVPSGGFMESDVHGSQQSIGLLEMKLSEEIRATIVALGLAG